MLATALRTAVLPAIRDVAPDGDAKTNFAFIESYFSNYVEGTKFSVEEAVGIVLRNAIVPSRPKDSRDVLGVFHQAMGTGTRDSVPAPEAGFVAGLQDRHLAMLGRRPEANPGQLKTEANYAGATRFVLPPLVRDTLQEGSKLAMSVPEGLARAIFYAFLLSETHPFDDGNGRLSRLTMNAELSRLGLCRIIIPTCSTLSTWTASRRLPVPTTRKGSSRRSRSRHAGAPTSTTRICAASSPHCARPTPSKSRPPSTSS